MLTRSSLRYISSCFDMRDYCQSLHDSYVLFLLPSLVVHTVFWGGYPYEICLQALKFFCLFLFQLVALSICAGKEETCSKENLTGDNTTNWPVLAMQIIVSGPGPKRTTKHSSATYATLTRAECKELKGDWDKIKEGKCAFGCFDKDLCNAGSRVSFSGPLAICLALSLVLLKWQGCHCNLSFDVTLLLAHKELKGKFHLARVDSTLTGCV